MFLTGFFCYLLLQTELLFLISSCKLLPVPKTFFKSSFNSSIFSLLVIHYLFGFPFIFSLSNHIYPYMDFFTFLSCTSFFFFSSGFSSMSKMLFGTCSYECFLHMTFNFFFVLSDHLLRSLSTSFLMFLKCLFFLLITLL